MRTHVSPRGFERRLLRWASMGVLLAVLVAPVVFDADDFPLSTYPMFARVRSSDVAFVTARGVDADGEIVALDLRTVGATDQPVIAAGELRAAIRDGESEVRCGEIAERVDPARGVVAVEIVTERHDVIDHSTRVSSLLERTVHASCAVGRSP